MTTTELIAEAGAEGAKIEVVSPEGRWPNDREQVEAVVAMWRDVGLDASIRVLGVADEYLATILGQPERPDAYFSNRSTSSLDGGNFAVFLIDDPVRSRWSVPVEVSDRFIAAASEADLEERDAPWREFYADMCEQSYILYLTSPPVAWAPRQICARASQPAEVRHRAAGAVTEIGPARLLRMMPPYDLSQVAPLLRQNATRRSGTRSSRPQISGRRVITEISRHLVHPVTRERQFNFQRGIKVIDAEG